jgi:7-keto-8-aminopelargonate synthetase-like enzyme
VLTAKEQGVSHLSAQDETYDGRHITIQENVLLNFGSYSYLGLENDPRLKEAAIQAIQKYGIQYPSSRAYVSNILYDELETLVQKMYGAPVVLTASLSIGHHGIMPIVIEDGDAVILDQQVHASVQDAARKLQLNGVLVTIVRHNNLEELKKKIEELSPKHAKIWYLCDGIYSMYGDVAPIGELVELADQYKQLYLYVDDAHGMSSFGKNGTGYVMSKTGLHPKMILCTGMAKAFGTIGGIYTIPDVGLASKVRNCTGPLIFSGQQATSILAASIASAKIHLSEEIMLRQNSLAEKICYCHRLLKEYKLPDISDPESPIFFVGLGMMSVAINLVKRMMQEGYYMNLAVFPAVPETCSGIRFTITLHLTLEDIEGMVKALARQFSLALFEEKRTVSDIQRAFKKVANLGFMTEQKESSEKPLYHVRQEHTIRGIDPLLWNNLLGNRGEYSWENLLLLENTFNQGLPEHQWSFFYFIITDTQGIPRLATFFTVCLCKDDMLAAASVSRKIEEERNQNPYHLTSRTLLMGTPVTSGQQWYIDRSYTGWREVVMLLLDRLMELQEKEKTELILLRDFHPEDKDLSDFFVQHSFIETVLPSTHTLHELAWKDSEAFLQQSTRHRKSYLKKVFREENKFEAVISSDEADRVHYWYKLYTNVTSRGMELNTFRLPELFFENIMKNEKWEAIELFLKHEDAHTTEKPPLVAVMFCYKGAECYTPLYVGMDYEYQHYNIYAQILWQTIKRAKQLNYSKVNLGFTASQNKQKFGAEPVSQVGYAQLTDHYKMLLIGLMPNESK